MQIAECKMKNEGINISERLLSFASGVIKLVVRFNKTRVGCHIAAQLTRSATSCGANYEEACGAESRNDFLHKMQIVLKELKESLYWLRLIEKPEIYFGENLHILRNEADELIRIIAKSIITAKSKK